MNPSNPIDKEIVKMYNDGAPIDDITSHFRLSQWTIYKRLHDNGVSPNRKTMDKWSSIEEYQLIAAYLDNVTGQGYCEWVPTRTYEAIQSRLKKLRRVKGGVVR